MGILLDPLVLLTFAVGIGLAFVLGRLGRKVYDRLRPARPPSGPPPSRQVRRAARRRAAKRDRR